MNILIDTDILLWALNDDEKLSKKAREIILDNDNIIYYSPISIWEIELKHSIHKDEMPYGGNKVYEYAEKGGYIECPLFSKQVMNLEEANKLNGKEHKDPFDNMLLSQALTNNFYFLTHDKLFSKNNYKRIILV